MKIRLPLFLFLLLPAMSLAQAPATPPSGTVPNVEVDPIRCWWRTSAGAVRTGETFDLSLTCATLENESVQVVTDESRLAPAVIQMAPFEVVTGSHPADLRSGQRRFFQYQYTLRIISPDAIGHDIRIPDMTLHYRVNSRVEANAALQGRDLVYLLPFQTIRVTSLVPLDTIDIRDTPGESFGILDTLEFRASALQIAAITFTALGSVMVLIAAVGLVRGTVSRTPAGERLLSPRGVVNAAARELAAVQRERERNGWSEALAGRALAAARIVAASAIGRSVNQRPADASVASGDGRIVTAKVMGGKRRALSSPMTADELGRYLAKSAAANGGHEETIDGLRRALAGFSAAQYGRDGALDETALDSALSDATSSARLVKGQQTWLKDILRRVRAGRGAVESPA